MRLDDPAAVGRYLQSRRKKLGLTQADLARQAGVSLRWVSSLESGKPTVELGKVFEVFYVLDVALVADELENAPGGNPREILREILDRHRGPSGKGSTRE